MNESIVVIHLSDDFHSYRMKFDGFSYSIFSVILLGFFVFMQSICAFLFASFYAKPNMIFDVMLDLIVDLCYFLFCNFIIYRCFLQLFVTFCCSLALQKVFVNHFLGKFSVEKEPAFLADSSFDLNLALSLLSPCLLIPFYRFVLLYCNFFPHISYAIFYHNAIRFLNTIQLRLCK